MLQIITDSTSGILQEEAQKLNITVLPINIDFDNQIFYDGVNISAEDFYQKAASSGTLPATLQPNALEYIERFEDAKNNGDTILVITPSAALSGIFNSAKLYADEANSPEIAVLDSQNIACGMRLVVLEAVKLRDEMNLRDLVSHLERFRLHIHSFATTDNLDLLIKSERLQNTAKLPKCVLNIKPIIALQNGEITFVDKKIGTKNAVDFIIEKIKNIRVSCGYPITIQFTQNASRTEYPAEVIAQLFSHKSVEISAMPCLIGYFLGDNATVITFVGK